MTLTTAQSSAYTRLRKTSGSEQAVPLSDDSVRALIYIALADLGLDGDVEVPKTFSLNLYSPAFTVDVECPGPEAKVLYEAALAANPECETYVACLSAIHKARLKYLQVLSTQPFASMDQVAPRGLLQYMQLDAFPLAALLVWRKWLYDLDNRAAQDTGYLFEPVIAGAIGGVPVSAKNSPIKRIGLSGGRQVDCLKDTKAYEIKIRITIAASGQGRWSEELSFPREARAAGYIPVLVVLDPTPNPKLTELIAAFKSVGGSTYVGDDAWAHLKAEAGAEMATFLEKYIREPLDEIYLALDEGEPLPKLTITDMQTRVKFKIGETEWHVNRVTATDSAG